MLLEFTWGWPFIRKHACTVAPRLTSHARAIIRKETAQPDEPVEQPHQTRVRVDVGLGVLSHHTAAGWVVQLDNGETVVRTADELRYDVDYSDVTAPPVGLLPTVALPILDRTWA